MRNVKLGRRCPPPSHLLLVPACWNACKPVPAQYACCRCYVLLIYLPKRGRIKRGRWRLLWRCCLLCFPLFFLVLQQLHFPLLTLLTPIASFEMSQHPFSYPSLHSRSYLDACQFHLGHYLNQFKSRHRPWSYQTVKIRSFIYKAYELFFLRGCTSVIRLNALYDYIFFEHVPIYFFCHHRARSFLGTCTHQ